MIMFALVKNNKVISFLVEETQKLDFDESHSFFEFEWTDNKPPMVSDFSVVNGQLVY